MEKLRENHDDDVLVGGHVEKRPKESASIGTSIGGGSSSSGRFAGGHSGGGLSNLHIPLLELKRKQSVLRASLEELIVEYLRGLTAEGDNDLSNEYFEHNRERRKKRDHRTKTNTNSNDLNNSRDSGNSGSDGGNRNSRSNIISSTASTVGNDIEIDVLSERDDKRKRIQFSDGSITELDENTVAAETAATHGKTIKKELQQQPVCGVKKRRIIHLDRNVLESAVGNESDYEHNIRRLLNYR